MFCIPTVACDHDIVAGTSLGLRIGTDRQKCGTYVADRYSAYQLCGNIVFLWEEGRTHTYYVLVHAPERQHRPPSLRRLSETRSFDRVLSRHHCPVAAGSLPATQRSTPAHITHHRKSSTTAPPQHSIDSMYEEPSVRTNKMRRDLFRTGTKIEAKR